MLAIAHATWPEHWPSEHWPATQRFAPLGWRRLAEGAGAAMVCIVVNDLWR